MAPPDTRTLLLLRAGLLFLEDGEPTHERAARGFALELAELGYLPSSRLERRLAATSPEALLALRAWCLEALAAHVGGGRPHRILFRRFPEDIPADTGELWRKKVLVHFLQGAKQPCLFCRRAGTTHVLSCGHVVCERCFDGSSYAACPVCERPVDMRSPFFQPSEPRQRSPREQVRFRLLDAGDDLSAAARELFLALAERRQAMSPDDVEALVVLVSEHGGRILDWLPATIPVKENAALIFGRLLARDDAQATLAAAAPYLRTATDVLRLVAAYSGADPSLQAQAILKTVEVPDPRQPFWRRVADNLGVPLASAPPLRVTRAQKVKRFRVAKLPRPLRRALLEVLEGFDADHLVEDMLRHRSHWVGVGELLHPHDYAARFPKVARGFAVVRTKAPDGTPAPAFRTWASRLEAALRGGEPAAPILAERPGELARRFDHALRSAAPADRGALLEVFDRSLGAMSTPVLLTLAATLRTRRAPLPARIFWPKGRLSTGVSRPDTRPLLDADVVAHGVRGVEAELLLRFSRQPRFERWIVDAALADVVAPFNERTASASAVALSRGSRITIPPGKIVRAFLHWCEPEGGETTDLDLSLVFYDDAWRYLGVCSYYQLQLAGPDREPVATSAGDLQAAPFPDGATELVDIHRDRARALGARYAVMVVNAYSGLAFSQLERAFAGIMLRDDPDGLHFDPRTVELKFALAGAHGIYMPLVLDLERDLLHWLDVYSKGELALNNAATSNRAITTVCPEMIAYFGAGSRLSMLELALLHAAARGTEVLLRGPTGTERFARGDEESPADFLARLRRHEGGTTIEPSLGGAPVFAALYRGELELPAGSRAYALFRERLASPIAASELIV